MTDALSAPLDVKLMNLTASALFVGCLLLVLAAGGWWFLRHPVFALGRITLQGDLVHITLPDIRKQVVPNLHGNFFTIDLERARVAFESATWVRHASVQRAFPNQLRVVLEEQVPVAYWGEEGSLGMLNSFGEVFDANPSELEQDDMPRLMGPAGRSVEVLDMYGRLRAILDTLELDLDELELTPRGSWRGRLGTGGVVEFGSGTHEDVLVRTRRLVRTLPQVSARYGRSPALLDGADLRHSDGYALRLRGVTTVAPVASKR